MIENKIEEYLENLKSKSLYRELKNSERKEYKLNFTTNDYLQLAKNKPFSYRNSYGSSSSRLFADNKFYDQTEKKLAKFKGKEEAMVFPSGYQANASVVSALLSLKLHEKQPLVFTDRLIHASIHAGLKIAGVRQNRFNNVDMNHLESLLNEYKNSAAAKFIFTESLFGMDGTITNLHDLTFLAKKHNAFIYLDEAHAVGLYGENGQGLSHEFADDIGVVMGSFSKAFGLQGGYISCSSIIKKYLVNNCGGFIYSTAPMVNLFPAIQQKIDEITSMHSERENIQKIAKYIREKFIKHGLNIASNDNSHIISVVIGDSKKVIDIKKQLNSLGIDVAAVRYPTVPLNTDRIRFAIHSGLTMQAVTDYLDDIIKTLLINHAS